MSDDLSPVIAGLLIGVALIAAFGYFHSTNATPTTPATPNDNRVWVAKNTTQCDDPWYNENVSVFDYFFKRQIWVHSTEIERYLKPGQLVCQACFCTSGNTLYLEIDETDVQKIQEYGFIVKTPNFD